MNGVILNGKCYEVTKGNCKTCDMVNEKDGECMYPHIKGELIDDCPTQEGYCLRATTLQPFEEEELPKSPGMPECEICGEVEDLEDIEVAGQTVTVCRFCKEMAETDEESFAQMIEM